MYPIGQLIFLGDAITVSYHLFTYTGLILMFGLIIICTSIIVKKLDEKTINILRTIYSNYKNR